MQSVAWVKYPNHLNEVSVSPGRERTCNTVMAALVTSQKKKKKSILIQQVMLLSFHMFPGYIFFLNFACT